MLMPVLVKPADMAWRQTEPEPQRPQQTAAVEKTDQGRPAKPAATKAMRENPAISVSNKHRIPERLMAKPPSVEPPLLA